MKKVININFQGRVTPIEEDAYMSLQQYIDSLRRFFSNEEGKDEIINDIESRIAELFSEVLKKGTTCITNDNVNAVIASIGRPEDFEDDEAKVQNKLSDQSEGETGNKQGATSAQHTTSGTRKLFRDENNKIIGGVCGGLANYFNIDPTIMRIIFLAAFFGAGVGFLAYVIIWLAVPSTATQQIGSPRKRLLRDTENKYLGGVCSGLAYYFGINVWIPRILFLIPFLSFAFRWNDFGPWTFPHLASLTFSPGSTFIYIILWLVLPEAVSTSDKLEMKGEKVDLNNIRNTISEEMKGVGQRVGKVSAEMGQTITEKGKQISGDVSGVARRSGSTIGDIIAMFFKIVSYFILAVVLISVLSALFGLGVAGTSLIPFKEFLLNEGWQSIFAWGTLIFFVWVPVVGIIVWVIRRLTKAKSNSSVITFTFIALWIAGWFSLIGLITSMVNEFKGHNNAKEQSVAIANPGVSKLEIKTNGTYEYYSNNNWFHIEPFETIDGDTVYVPNIKMRIVKSSTDSFQIKMVKLCNGPSTAAANSIAEKLEFNIVQHDTALLLDRGIAINKQNKFRNQSVIVTIAVPVGKRIYIDEDAFVNSNFEFVGDNNDWFWREDRDAYDYEKGVEYVMTSDGLKPANEKEAFKLKWDDDDDIDMDINITIDEAKAELEKINRKIEEELEQNESEKKEKLQELKDEQKRLEELLRRYENKNSTDSGYQYKPAAIKLKDIKKDLVPTHINIKKETTIQISEIARRFSI